MFWTKMKAVFLKNLEKDQQRKEKEKKKKKKLKCSADLIFNLEYYFSVSDD